MASLTIPPLLLLLLLLLTLYILSAVAQPPSSSPPPPQPLVNAVETLANSGFTSMSLTLQLNALTLPLPSAAATTALTIFSPPDAAFSSSGQPSLPLLLLHLSPLALSPASLLSLPFSSTIPSLSPAKHLTLTSNHPGKITINNVAVSEIPIFDDGFVIVYAIDNFFDLNFLLKPTDLEISYPNYPRSEVQCLKLEPISHFKEASGVLKSRGHAIMAAFLELQLLGFLNHQQFSENAMRWTVFAPLDQDLLQYSENFPEYFSVFMRHMAPCKVDWRDLDEMENDTAVSNNVRGFTLKITKDEDAETVMVNGVEITFANMYDSEWLVVHGIRGVIPLPESFEED